jgi:hypothetical protein
VPGAVVTLPAEVFNYRLAGELHDDGGVRRRDALGLDAGIDVHDAGRDVTCTYTNTRVARNLTLKKAWVNGKNGDAITATTTGLTNNATVGSTSTGSNTDTGVAASNVPARW